MRCSQSLAAHVLAPLRSKRQTEERAVLSTCRPIRLKPAAARPLATPPTRTKASAVAATRCCCFCAFGHTNDRQVTRHDSAVTPCCQVTGPPAAQPQALGGAAPPANGGSTAHGRRLAPPLPYTAWLGGGPLMNCQSLPSATSDCVNLRSKSPPARSGTPFALLDPQLRGSHPSGEHPPSHQERRTLTSSRRTRPRPAAPW